MIWIALFIVLLTYAVRKIVNHLNYWPERKVPYKKTWPIIGNLKDLILQKKNLAYIVQDWYKEFPGKRYYGTYMSTVRCLLVKDLDLIKKITVKDFDYFPDHINVTDTEQEPIFGKNLIALTGRKWKDMRNTLSPSFTGNKIRIMFHLISDCAKQFNEHFLSKTESVIEFEAKDLMTRISVDIIATIAFGLRSNSISGDSEFYTMGTALTKPSIASMIRGFIQILFPRLSKAFKISQLSKNSTKFFEDVIKETLRVREEQNIVRPDMIHILMEARKAKKNPKEDGHQNISDTGFPEVEETVLESKESTPNNEGIKVNKEEIEITNEDVKLTNNELKFNSKENLDNQTEEKITVNDIIAQGFLFFLAGFETISTLLAHVLNELAVNPDIQTKLQVEIDKAFEESNQELNYETLIKMKYLDMVISETLRKWPPSIFTNRSCVQDYTIEASEKHSEREITIEKGTGIIIPTFAIHRDPNYYPDPDKFDPDRFGDGNKHRINPHAYLPFGIGPRNCIGSRLALLESKVLLTYLLREFDVVTVEKTQIPLVLSSKKPGLVPDGFWLGLKMRNSS